MSVRLNFFLIVISWLFSLSISFNSMVRDSILV